MYVYEWRLKQIIYEYMNVKKEYISSRADWLRESVIAAQLYLS